MSDFLRERSLSNRDAQQAGFTDETRKSAARRDSFFALPPTFFIRQALPMINLALRLQMAFASPFIAALLPPKSNRHD